MPRPVTPDVEKLSDIAWQRVEKNLFAALDCDAAVAAPTHAPRARGWQPWAVAGGLALACTAAAIVLLRPAPTTDRTGSGSSLAEASRVVTQDAPTDVSYGDATITVEAQSALTMAGDAQHGVIVTLERGGATFEVAPREQRPPYVVYAGDAIVRVIGTRFHVSRSGDAARVDVTEGHVEVVARGVRVQVRAGESWSSDGDWEAVVRGQAASQGGIAAAPYVSRGSADGTSGPPPTTQQQVSSGQPSGGGEPGDARSGDGSTHDGSPWEGRSSAGAVANPRPRQRSSRSTDASDVTPKLDDRTLFEQAGAKEPSDPAGAMKLYRELAKGKGAWASAALYAAGRLAADRHDSDAASLLQQYLDRFPHGANVADARRLLDQLH